MRPLVPPHPNAEAHRAFLDDLSKMTPKEIFQSAVASGIYDKDGNLTPEFGGVRDEKGEAA